MNSDRGQLSRRAFLKVGAQTTGALIIGFHLPLAAEAPPMPGSASAQEFTPNAWLRIGADDRVTVLVEKPELGQGSRTYTPMMIAEELEVDWPAISIEQAPTIPSIYTGLRTGGSGGVAHIFTAMRQAGAQARELLLTAAARQWNVSRSECRAEQGTVVHTRTGRKLRYGQLVAAASKLPPPGIENVRLKDPKGFRVIGRPMPRTDVPSKADGSARFGIDTRVPGMLFAVIARCPYFGGRLRSFDATAAKKFPGVRAVLAVPPLPRHYNTAGGVAVVADSTWAAIRAREQLVIEWDRGPRAGETTASLREAIQREASAGATFVAIERGDARAALATATRTLTSDYESPFQAHATMEPMNTTVHARAGEIEVWSPTQFADEVQREIAALSGLPLGKVIVHMTLSGGSFGRRYQWDYAAEAWQVAQEMSAPVQLLFTREDDMQHDFYRPYNYQRLTAGMDGDGKLVAWSTRIVTTPIAVTNAYTGMDPSAEALKDPANVAALEWYGADLAPYAVPNFLLDYAPADSVVPRSWWRSVASSYTPFAKECFLDEIAHACGKDPLEFRMELLAGDSRDKRRLRNALQLAADKAGWSKPLPARHGRGLACRVGETCSAQVAEVFVDDEGAVHVRRVVSAVDCGIAVNPDTVRAMTEGAIGFALTAVLNAQITIKDGAVEQTNFDDYPVLRMDQAPEVEVHIVPSGDDPSGVGELGAMLIAPAVGNAIFAATGVRVRRLPVDPSSLRASHA